MVATTDIEEVHQAIGEFVVFFQSIEDMYRQIGWFLVDPERVAWPPRQFLKESNRDLIDKVTDLFIELTHRHAFPNGAEKVAQAEELRGLFHALRKFRNRMVHSAYHEVVAEGQIVEIQRSNPQFIVDSDTGEIEYDQEPFDPATIRKEMSHYAQAFFILHSLHKQLIHWHSFSR
jgi:hypothetical protein